MEAKKVIIPRAQSQITQKICVCLLKINTKDLVFSEKIGIFAENLNNNKINIQAAIPQVANILDLKQ